MNRMATSWRVVDPAPVVAELYSPPHPEGVEPGIAVAEHQPACRHPVPELLAG